ncbi:MAG: hypothetical protein COW01_04680 [Bdellovibrionales bacterium CG12_big_fil_rev_8_21_14_0_65_38_15]|nr:MAG: hypothetical protein COW79_12000 [Bdellovibrionales bacterium CG22_combo_CG10-13_8_21_14_all_38_13]PIQ56353.1 MAG: hypothetical protein COW01_04680 [Bdellovibrionales bacterium CG12_big_fil_rev_8_21_14_0_65_38_15]PIR29384.1 MAG: hypothetical protein COV38_11615 [Bdellovibrionales bacterium CG11_big_fil_rev_8_21_14_0_20_38_13]
MSKSPKDILENTLFLWSVVQNSVLQLNSGDIIGRSLKAYADDQYLDKEHLKFELNGGKWHLLSQETTNGTQLNDDTLQPAKTIALSTSDIIIAGDQIFFILGRELLKLSTREEFLATVKIKSAELAEQVKAVQVRSVAFFKLEYPNYIKLMKKNELLYKVEIATAKKAHDLKPFIAKIDELTQKKNKIASAWDAKISEFNQMIEDIEG